MAPERRRLYDSHSGRLVYLAQAATETFWDDQWAALSQAVFVSPPAHRMTVRITRKYLPLGSAILEGGCGLGDKVYALDKAGFDAIGVDFAPRVIAEIKRNWPDLKVQVGDVRKLPFSDATFDGYWSLGVIEHFFGGYRDIAGEMRRVLRPGGYLFLTFPMMNNLRYYQVSRKKYPPFEAADHDRQLFYQFALRPEDVIETLQALGFSLEYRAGLSVRACLGEEFSLCHKINKYLDRLGIGSKVGRLADALIGRYAGHSCLLVFQRKA